MRDEIRQSESTTGAAVMASPAIAFHGLLYIDRQRNSDPNLWSLDDPIAVYVGCASLLASSARAAGQSFGLFTNAPDEVERIVRERGLAPFPITGIEFSRSVPRVGKFYSAHFKIDAMTELASGRHGQLVGLIDVDTVFLRAMPPDIGRAAANGFVAYDVSSGEAPLHFDRNLVRDLTLVAGKEFATPVWYGGEFLATSSDRLRLLVDEVEECWPRYAAHAHRLHHVGDETTVSAALNRLQQRGETIVDAGSLGLIARWWPVRTKYPQPAFEELEDRIMLHLPGDKNFLARQAVGGFERARFLADYKLLRRRHRALRRWLGFLDPHYSAVIERA